MKYINIFFTGLISFVLFACSNGAARTGINPEAYGQLQSFESLDSITSTGVLHAGVTPLGACFNVNLESNPNVVTTTGLSSANAESVCASNVAYIQNINESSLFNMSGATNLSNFVVNNTASVTGVQKYKIIYNTPGQAYGFGGGAVSNETVSGLVIVPQGGTIKGVVLYYHGTIFSKNDVPSNPSSSAGGYDAWMLSTIYASQGYIVVAPDYVGQGVDVGVMHPFVLYAQTNALSGIYMLPALKQMLAGLSTTITLPSKLYISSYSEGGGYALWASRLLQGQYASVLSNTGMSLKRTVGISGPYDLSGSMIPYAYNISNNSQNPALNTYNASPGITSASPYNTNGLPAPLDTLSGLQQTIANYAMSGSKAALGSYAFAAFINYNYTQAAYSVFFQPDGFANMTACLDTTTYLAGNPISATSCPITDTLANLFMKSKYKNADIANTIIDSAMISSNYFTGGKSFGANQLAIATGGTTNNTVGAFANPVLSDPTIMPYIRAADTWSFTTNSPISLIYLNYDSTVTNLDSINACSGIQPSINVTCLSLDNRKLYTTFGPLPIPNTAIAMMLDHGDASFDLNLIALNQIQQTP